MLLNVYVQFFSLFIILLLCGWNEKHCSSIAIKGVFIDSYSSTTIVPPVIGQNWWLEETRWCKEYYSLLDFPILNILLQTTYLSKIKSMLRALIKQIFITIDCLRKWIINSSPANSLFYCYTKHTRWLFIRRKFSFNGWNYLVHFCSQVISWRYILVICWCCCIYNI